MESPDPDPAEDEVLPANVGGLLDDYRAKLRRMLALRLDPRLRRRLDAEDILQEAFAEVVARLDEYRSSRPMPFYLWVRRLTAQKVAQFHQHHFGAAARDAEREVTPGRMPLASSASLARAFAHRSPTPSEDAARREIFTRVRAALERLDEVDREVLALRYFERLTTEEAAIVLELSPSGVEKRQLRALAHLKRELPRMEDVPTPP